MPRRCEMPPWFPLAAGTCGDERAAFLAEVSYDTARDWRIHMGIAPYRNHSRKGTRRYASRSAEAATWLSTRAALSKVSL